MMIRDTVTIRTILAAAGLAATAMSPLALGQTAAPQGSVFEVSTGPVRESLDKAADLLRDRKFIQARELLMPFAREQAGTLSDPERDRLYKLLNNASERINGLSPVELSLQTAEDALTRDDLVTAERHARAVIDSPKAINEQTASAKAVMATAQTRRAELAPTMAHRLNSAAVALEAGRRDEARTSLDAVLRSGVELTAEQTATLEACRNNIAGIGEGSMGMMQPGVIRRREPQQPAVTPVSQPTPASPTTAPATQPMAQPPAQPAMQPAQPADAQPDVLAQARRFEAASILAEADFAFNAARMRDAAPKYSRVLSQFGDVLTAEQRAHAEARLVEAQTRMNVNPGQDGNILGGAIEGNRIAHDQALAEFTNDIEQANRALTTGEPGRARDLAASANLRLNTARNFFSATEFETMSKQVADLRSQIDTRESAIRADEAGRRETDLAAQAERDRQLAARSKNEKISQSVARARELQRNMQFEQALQVVDDILFLDPNNPTGLVLREVLMDQMLYIRSGELTSAKNRGVATMRIENQAAIVPPSFIIDYPSDWPSVIYRRGEPIAFNDTEENRRALAVIDKKSVPAAFNETPFESVVAFLQTVTQLNIDVDYPSLAEKGIEKDAPVTLNLTNVPVRTILDRVVEKISPDPTDGAAWSVNDGVLTIASKEVIDKNKILQIYDIRDLLIEVPDYANAPEFDLQSVLQSTGGGGGGGGGQSPFRDNNQQAPPRRSLEDRTNDFITIITTNVDSPGWQENGGDTGFIQQLQGNLIITQTPANHRAVHGLLSKLRENRAMQINVETRFLLVSQDYFEEFGVDIDVYFNGRNNQVRTARAGRPTTRPGDFFDFAAGGLQETFPQSPATGANTTRTPLPSPLSVVGAGQNSLGISESLLQSDFGSTILSGAPALGVAGQFLDDIQVDFLVKATQADRRTVTLTAPRLTFTNGQTSNIYVATQVAFVSDLTPVVSESAVGFDPQLATVNEGVRLLVDGTIAADRRYVTLNVDASVAKIEGFQNTPVTAVAGGQLVNSAATQSFIQLPTVTVTRVTTTVTVPDQGTILLGGQRLVTESEVESGVPVLSKIPIVNRFFSNRVMSKEEQTLLILLKPTILIQNEEEERNFPGNDDSMRNPYLGG